MTPFKHVQLLATIVWVVRSNARVLVVLESALQELQSKSRWSGLEEKSMHGLKDEEEAGSSCSRVEEKSYSKKAEMRKRGRKKTVYSYSRLAL